MKTTMKKIFFIPVLLTFLIAQSQKGKPKTSTPSIASGNVTLTDHDGNQYKLSNGLCSVVSVIDLSANKAEIVITYFL